AGAWWRETPRHTQTNQIGRQFRQPIIVIVRPAEFDRHIAAFHESGFAQTSEERCYEMCSRLGGTSIDISDHRQRGLLCPCRNRPRRPAAERRDELAAPCMSGKEHCEG